MVSTQLAFQVQPKRTVCSLCVRVQMFGGTFFEMGENVGVTSIFVLFFCVY